MRTSTRVAISVPVLTLFAVLSVPTIRAAADQEVDVEKMIQTAKTRADHEALAVYYDKLAAEAKANAEKHRKMGEDYKKGGGPMASKTHFHEHCEAITRSYESAAKEYGEMAKGHRQMAKEAK